ncbi:MAG TPA: hypothetical protein VLA96_11040 [Terriglobales bacterium]|nr:hypothetical protein [Terriglobales bacterium]
MEKRAAVDLRWAIPLSLVLMVFVVWLEVRPNFEAVDLAIGLGGGVLLISAHLPLRRDRVVQAMKKYRYRFLHNLLLFEIIYQVPWLDGYLLHGNRKHDLFDLVFFPVWMAALFAAFFPGNESRELA